MAEPIAYPSQSQWEQSFTRGLKAAASGVELSPAVTDMVSFISLVIEDATGKPLAAAVAEGAADLIAQIAREMMDGTLELAGDLAGTLGNLASSVGSIIPIFADAIDKGMAALDAAEELQQERLKRMTQSSVNFCRGRYLRPMGTGIRGAVTPGDFFRPIFEAREDGPRNVVLGGPPSLEYRYPLTAASIICALCGPQSPLGWNLDKRKSWTPPEGRGSAGGATVREYICHQGGPAGYEVFISFQRKRTGNPNLGLSLDIRTRLALIVEGIIASARPYTYDKVDPVGDQGRALFPVLTDVLLHEHRAGRWDIGFLQALQRSQIGCFSVINYKTGKTLAPVVDLAADVDAWVMDWKNTVERASAGYPARRAYLTGSARKSLYKASPAFKVPRPKFRPKFRGRTARRAPAVRRGRGGVARLFAGLAVAGLAAAVIARRRR